jgi:glucose/arabinose dehydrogenase
MKRSAMLIGLALLAGACGGEPQPSGPSPSVPSPVSPTPAATATPKGAPDLASVHLTATEIAKLDEPLGMAVAPGDQALYVAEKTGRIMAIRGGRVDPQPVLDLSGEISHGGEQGLLGLAFDPDGRFLYVNFTDSNGNTNVVEYAWRSGHVARSSRRRVLFVEQPFSNHNGGNVVFGPDGHLYVGLGDGGSAGDPLGNAPRGTPIRRPRRQPVRRTLRSPVRDLGVRIEESVAILV